MWYLEEKGQESKRETTRHMERKNAREGEREEC